MSDYIEFFVTGHDSRFAAIASKRPQGERVIDLSAAGQREGENFVAKMQ